MGPQRVGTTESSQGTLPFPGPLWVGGCSASPISSSGPHIAQRREPNRRRELPQGVPEAGTEERETPGVLSPSTAEPRPTSLPSRSPLGTQGCGTRVDSAAPASGFAPVCRFPPGIRRWSSHIVAFWNPLCGPCRVSLQRPPAASWLLLRPSSFCPERSLPSCCSAGGARSPDMLHCLPWVWAQVSDQFPDSGATISPPPPPWPFNKSGAALTWGSILLAAAPLPREGCGSPPDTQTHCSPLFCPNEAISCH